MKSKPAVAGCLIGTNLVIRRLTGILCEVRRKERDVANIHGIKAPRTNILVPAGRHANTRSTTLYVETGHPTNISVFNQDI